MKGVYAFIPAQPGYFVLEPIYDGDKITEYQKMPVIGWFCEAKPDSTGEFDQMYPQPVCVEVMESDLPIQQPDGSVIVQAELSILPTDTNKREEVLKYLNDRAYRMKLLRNPKENPND